MDAHHPQERGESSGAQDDEGGVHRAAAGGSGGHGNRGDDGPFLSAQQEMVAPEVHNIGDSYNTQKPGNMWQATKAAYNLAIKI